MANEEAEAFGVRVGNLNIHAEPRLNGKVAIITGGAMGIGEAIVRLFTKHGAKVIIADIADEAGRKLAESLSPPAIFLHCDVSKEEDIKAAVDLAVEKHGQLDIMYNNAGTAVAGKEGLKGSSPRLMIVSDLDNTMVDHHDPENISLLRFNALWEADYRHDSLLVFSTGRSPTLYKELRKEKPLLTPDITIMSVGTEITYGDSMSPDKGWEEVLNQGWDRGTVVEEASRFPQLKFQVETEQRPHKVSFYIEKTNSSEVINALSKRLEERQLDVKIIYSGGIDLDILPQGAGKGQALAYLLKKFNSEGKSPQNTLVCGDSGNDAELFSVADVYGVMVGNAQEELLQWYEENAKGNPKVILAHERCAAGIIQAMQHFNLDPNVSPRDIVGLSQTGARYFLLGHEIVEFHLLCERWRRAEVEDSNEIFQRFKSAIDPKCSLLHPWGVEENLFTGIDVLRQCYGDQKGKQFRIWIDRIRPLKISSDIWLVRFDKWELIEQERRCCCTTALLKLKPDAPNSLSWIHIHETWLDGCGSRTNLCCSI